MSEAKEELERERESAWQEVWNIKAACEKMSNWTKDKCDRLMTDSWNLREKLKEDAVADCDKLRDETQSECQKLKEDAMYEW